jgi:hypothetical protein
MELTVEKKDLRKLLIAGAVILALCLPVLEQDLLGGLEIWAFFYLVVIPHLGLPDDFGALVWGCGWTALLLAVVLF